MEVAWWVSLLQALVVINLVMATFAYLTLAERKVMARMQLRYGPNRTGPYGLLQPIADLLKLLHKESFNPAAATDWLYLLGPFLAAFTALVTFSLIPFGPGWEIAGVYIPGQVADLDIALILVFAVGSIGAYGFIVGGWASDSKYSLLGAMRTCAQLVSYEVSLALSVLGVSTVLAAAEPQGAVVGTTAILDGSFVSPQDEYARPLFAEVAHRFTARVYRGHAYSDAAAGTVRAVLERERPAHTTYHVCVVEPRMRVGVQARVGIDAVVGGTAEPTGLGDIGGRELLPGLRVAHVHDVHGGI